MPAANLFVPYLERDEFTAVAAKLARNRNASSWWMERSLGVESAMVVLARVRPEESFEWGRVLSRESGGFCVTRGEENATPAVFNSGWHLKPARGDTWQDCFEQLCGVAWRGIEVDFLDEVYLQRRWTETSEKIWTRAVFANTTGDALAGAGSEADTKGLPIRGWRWLERKTPLAGLPFVLVERTGRCDPTLMHFVSKALDRYAAALELRPDSEALWWWFDPAHAAKSGSCEWASEVVGLWHDLTVTMGEAAGVIRWPAREAGFPLAETGPGTAG
jgi:hypothetical protein